MNEPEGISTPAAEAPLEIVRPVGTWVIGGFLLIVVVTIWFLVSVLFMHRAGGNIPS
ncbi:hypothetical protein [Lichenicoccus roseus]|uniref:hypothetical protein n=1 Tax=Lichenicoccus roseus TaxID=2683649 RepID=UPI0014861691|nr:hypothetical protein [Lichenicoccus roseus]